MMLRKHSNVVSLTLMMLTSWRKFLIFWGFSLLEKSCLMVILSVSLTQQSFIDSLLDSLNMSFEGQSSYLSPYRSGLHIDSIPCQDMSPSDRDRLRLQYHSLVGSLNWLAHTLTQIYLLLFPFWPNIRVCLLRDIMILNYMW